jgi:glucose-6-phosphate isomerase
MPPSASSPAWQAVKQAAHRVADTHLRTLFSQDPHRAMRYSIDFPFASINYSRQRIDDNVLKALFDFARESDITGFYQAMMSGKPVNATEQRAVLHYALRAASTQSFYYQGRDIMPDIQKVKQQIADFSSGIRNGVYCGYTGKKFTDIVNIGIGGSDLGPHMVVDALKPFADRSLRMHFVSNVDPTHISETLRLCRPETTLFLIASKTFTTEETMANAHAAKAWFLESGAQNPELHFAAISTNFAATAQFGIKPERVFIFWDWVGGRFSLWSAIGLSIAISIGPEHFEQLLQGAAAMDQHAMQAEPHQNAPLVLALLGILNSEIYDMSTHAVLPYDEYLRLLPAFLQQMLMESNGKYISRKGDIVEWNTSQIWWGQPGTDSQHSFFQLLHQGTRNFSSDFIACAKSHNARQDMHQRLLANFLAQTEALMNGKNTEQVLGELQAQGYSPEHIQQLLPHKVFTGNRVSTTILLESLNPFTLGWLIALYEHITCMQGILWDIYSFDQWGVELGKQLARNILPAVKDINASDPKYDAATAALLQKYHQMKG